VTTNQQPANATIETQVGPWQRRWHPLLEQWTIIASSSAKRPWSGAMASPTDTSAPAHDPHCYLCPRVTRASGSVNPDYTGTLAFDNDFPSLSFSSPQSKFTENPQLEISPAQGMCRVLCWSERHDATLGTLSRQQMQAVAALWQDEYTTLSADERILQVNIFENKGVEIGVSNLHPHGQVYAMDFVSDVATRMRRAQAKFAEQHAGESLLQHMLNTTWVREQLVVEASPHWTVLVPFAARFAYETWIVPQRHVSTITELTLAERDDLALVYQRQVLRYNRVFQRVAPNITLLHNAPCDGHEDNRAWCFHIGFQPPLRDAEKLKYLGGFEAGEGNTTPYRCLLLPRTLARRSLAN